MPEQVLGLFDGRLTERQLQSNRTNILEGITDACTRNLQMMALLQQSGNILYGQGGFGMFWKIKHKLHRLIGSNGERARNYNQVNQYKTARLDYRGYEVNDTISRKELKQNRGDSAVIKIFDDFEQNLITSMEQGLGPQFYGDGDNVANPDSWHGLLSMVRQTGKPSTPRPIPHGLATVPTRSSRRREPTPDWNAVLVNTGALKTRPT